jgi:hypothetical protein
LIHEDSEEANEPEAHCGAGVQDEISPPEAAALVAEFFEEEGGEDKDRDCGGDFDLETVPIDNW